MTRKQKIGLMIAVLAVIIMLIILWLLRKQEQVVMPAVVVPIVEEETVSPEPVAAPEISILQEQRDQSAGLQSLAKTFTERYGSFSTEADFANLADVILLMTPGFAEETQLYIDTATMGESFYGVTTRVISLSVDQLDEEAGVAVITLSTQRQEAVDSPQNVSVKYQDIVLEFEKISGSWKVSSAIWL